MLYCEHSASQEVELAVEVMASVASLMGPMKRNGRILVMLCLRHSGR